LLVVKLLLNAFLLTAAVAAKERVCNCSMKTVRASKLELQLVCFTDLSCSMLTKQLEALTVICFVKLQLSVKKNSSSYRKIIRSQEKEFT
jgi:acetolactate synthase regulatory subunit